MAGEKQRLRQFVAGMAAAVTLGLAGTAFAASAGSGQGYGLKVEADVAGINLGVPLADTTLLNAPPDRNASESVVNAAVSAGNLLKVNAAVANGTMQSALAQSSVVSTGGVNGLNVSLVNAALIPVSLLRVTADTVSSRAQMACSAGNPAATGTSTIENLKITALGLNVPVVVNPAANTTISVAGIASVVLNEQIPSANGLTVNALHISVNVLNLITADVVVGHSFASMADCAAAPGSVTISVPNIDAGNQASVPVQGACTAGGGNVAISTNPAGGTASVPCGAGGTYSAGVDASALADGSIIFTATQDSQTASTTVTKNTTAGAPAVSVTAAPVINAANQAAYGGVQGTCSENGDPVTVTIGGVAATPAPTCTGSAWTAPAADVSSLPDGPVLVTASQTNGNGLGSGSLGTRKDATAPSVAVTTAPPINAGNVGAYGVSGTCTAGDGDVTVTIGGQAPVTTPCDTSGEWSISGQNVNGVADGPVTITATQTDTAGNTGTGSGNTTKDVTPPVVTVTAPAAINAGNQAAYDVSGTCTAGDGDVAVTLGTIATTTPCNAGNWSVSGLNVSGLPQGTVPITATQTDAAGNTGTGTGQATKTTAASADTTPPVVTVTAPVIDAGNQATYVPTGTCTAGDGPVTVTIGTAPHAVTVTAACDSGGNWTAPASNVSALPQGEVLVTATQTDAAGNTGTAQATTTKTTAAAEDTTPPVVTVTAPPINSGNQGGYTPSGACTAGDGDVTVTIGNLPPVAAACGDDGTWTAPPTDVSSLPQGEVTVTASQTDGAGNTGTGQATTTTKATPAAGSVLAPIPVGGLWAGLLLLATGLGFLRRRRA